MPMYFFILYLSLPPLNLIFQTTTVLLEYYPQRSVLCVHEKFYIIVSPTHMSGAHLNINMQVDPTHMSWKTPLCIMYNKNYPKDNSLWVRNL